MRYLAFIIVIFFSLNSFGQWYYGSGEAVNLENDIGYKKNSQKIKSGVSVDPKSVAQSGGAGSILMRTDGSLYIKMDSGSSTNWRKFLDDTFNVITSLGYTPENVSNKSTATTLGNSDTLYPSQNAVKTYVDAQKVYAGATTVPTFIDNGGGNITVNITNANLWDNTTFQGAAKNYTLASITQTLTDGVNNYIVGDYNGGSPIMRITTDVNEITESNIVPLLTVYRSGTTLHSLDWDSLGLGLANKVHQSIVKTQRYRRESGLAISESGTRNVNVSAGVLWVGANKQNISSIASLTDNIIYFQRTAPSAWTTQIIQSYNNTEYFNGTTTVALSNNRYAVNWLYRGVESQKHLYMVLGEGDYTLAQAQASQPPASLPPNITSHGILIGRIIVLKNAATAAQIDSSFNVVFTQSAASIHNDLSGLQGGIAGEYYHLTQAKFNAVENLTASGTQTNFTGGTQIPISSYSYYGDSVTDGSIRTYQASGALITEKRVSGSWVEIFRLDNL